LSSKVFNELIIAADFSDQMNTFYKYLYKEFLRKTSFVAKEISFDMAKYFTFQQGHTVINIAICNKETDYLSLVMHFKMQVESIKPESRCLSSWSNTF